MANTIEIVIKQTGAGNAIADASKALGSLGSSAKGVTGMLGGFASGLGNVATVATGIVAANLFGKIVDGITGFISTGLDAVASSQQLETSLKALLTSNNMYSQSSETVTQAITKQVMSEQELVVATDELTAKLNTQKATYQEQQQRIIDLTAAYGENGLNVIKAKAQHEQLALTIQATERDIAGLTTTETSYTTATKQSWKQTMDQASAFKLASAQTQDLLDFVSKLAVVSPFETETVEMTTKYAIAAGLGVEQTKEFVPAFLDLAGAVGITSDSLGFAADQLFQVKKIGKLTEVDLRQLRRLGIDLAKVIGVEMGMSVEEFNAQAANSPEIFDELFNAVTRFSQNTFAGTAKEMATSVKGLQSTFSDIFVIGARTFLRPLVDAATPAVSAIAGAMSDFVFSGEVAGMGQQLAEMFGKGMSAGKAIFSAFGRDWGEGIRMALYKFGFGPDSLAIVTDWIDQIKNLMSVFQTGGFFGEGGEGGILRALGLTDETVGILQDALGQVMALFGDFGTQLESITTADVLNALAVGFSAMVTGIVAGLNFVIPLISDLVIWLQSNLPGAVQFVTGLFTTSWPTIAATVMTAWTVLQAVFNGIVQGLTVTIGPAIDQIGAAFASLGISWADVGNALLTATGIVFAGIGAIILVAVSVIVGLVGAVASAVGTMVEYWGLLAQTVSTVIAGVMGLITSLQVFWVAVFEGDLPTALMAASTGFESFMAIVVGITASIITVVSGMVETVVSLFSGLVTSITGFWQGLFDTLVGHSIVPDMVNGIISWFTMLPESIMGALSGLTEEISAIFGGMFGGGEEAAAPTFDAATILAGMTTVTEGIALAQVQFDALVASVVNFTGLTLAMLQEVFLAVSTVMLEQFMMLLNTGLMPLDLAMVNMFTVTLPTLQAVGIMTANAINAAFMTVQALINAIIAAVNTLGGAFVSMGQSAVKAGNDIQKGMDDAVDSIEELIKTVKLATERFKGMAQAAREAAAAAASAGASSGAAGGLGFASGTGPLGFLVPPGYPNDSFPLRVQSGERVLVAPSGQSVEDIVGSRGQQVTNYYFSQTVNTRADSSSVIGDFNVMRGMLGA